MSKETKVTYIVRKKVGSKFVPVGGRNWTAGEEESKAKIRVAELESKGIEYTVEKIEKTVDAEFKFDDISAELKVLEEQQKAKEAEKAEKQKELQEKVDAEEAERVAKFEAKQKADEEKAAKKAEAAAKKEADKLAKEKLATEKVEQEELEKTVEAIEKTEEVSPEPAKVKPKNKKS